MSYQSMEEARLRCEREGISFWKAVQLEDAAERDVTETGEIPGMSVKGFMEGNEAYVAGNA